MNAKCKVNYGTEPIPAPALRHGAILSNGWYCVWTEQKPDGTIDADIYEDKTMRTLIRMEHGTVAFNGADQDPSIVAELIESFLQEIIDQC